MKTSKTDYIPVVDGNYHLFTRFDKPYWTPARHVPLSDIKVNKSLMAFPNDVNDHQVRRIVENFDPDFWLPVTLNSDGFLLDGQHRLEAARRMNLRYIDAVIQDTEWLNGKG